MYLIQRGEIKNRKKEAPIKENVTWDYMGSAEFEYGALPTSLRRIQRNFDKYKRVMFQDITNLEGASLIVMHSFESADELAEYKDLLVLLSKDKVDLKERSYFSSWFRNRDKWDKRYREDCNLWWDISNDVWFSFDKDYMKIVLDNWTESFKLMK
jgi:hypothetical protein